MNFLERIFEIIAAFIIFLLKSLIFTIEEMDKLAERKTRRKREKVH